jgi:hypothetical protein
MIFLLGNICAKLLRFKSVYIRFVVAFAILGVGFLQGCQVTESTQTRITLEQSSASKPDWIYKVPKQDKKYIYFVGVSSFAEHSEFAEKQAKSMALQKIYEYLQVKGKSEYKYERTKTSVRISDVLNIKTPFFILKNVTKTDQYFEKYSKKGEDGNFYEYFDYYVLLGLPVREINRIERNSRTNLKESYAFYLDAERYYLKNNLMKAIEKAQLAADRLRLVTFISSAVVDGKTIELFDLKQKIEDDFFIYKNALKTIVIKFSEPEDSGGAFRKNFVKIMTESGFEIISDDEEINKKYICIIGDINAEYIGDYTTEMKIFRAKGSLSAVIWERIQYKTLFEFDPSTVKHIGSSDKLAFESVLSQLGQKAGQYFVEKIDGVVTRTKL